MSAVVKRMELLHIDWKQSTNGVVQGISNAQGSNAIFIS